MGRDGGESLYICFFKQKTAYEMRISDWSSDVCSSDLKLARPGRLAEFTDGFDEVADFVAAFTPERAAAVSGIDAGTIRSLARRLAAASAAAVYGRMGVSTQAHGTLCQWAIAMLNIATGNRSEEHTSELQSLMRISYAVF